MTLDQEAAEGTAPQNWFLIFETETPVWWLRLLCPGRFKHVSACGFVPETNCWLFFSVELARTRVEVLPAGDVFRLWFSTATRGCGVLKVAAVRDDRHKVLRGFWCVPAVKHLLGIGGGALSPSALWRYCVDHGAEIITDGISDPESAECSGNRSAEGGSARC